MILTTHSMEEADIIGDRIAIMAKVFHYQCAMGLLLAVYYGSLTINLLSGMA